MDLMREPCAALRPFVKMLWAISEPASLWAGIAERERVLPTGDIHIAIRLCDQPVRLFADTRDAAGQTLGHAVIGGPRAAFYVRDISMPVSTVGAQIQGVAARLLFGMPACEFAGRHTRLDDVWGLWAGVLREQLMATTSLKHRLDLLERALVSRLRTARRLHPAVAHALERLPNGRKVRDVVKETGYSHRRFIALFREETGLTPKVFCRVLRFRNILQRFALAPALSLSELAYEGGYSDQAHFNREFREFAGVTPETYRSFSGQFASHVPVLNQTDAKGQFRSRLPGRSLL
jgi:AraC-like DNA-binding protein